MGKMKDALVKLAKKVSGKELDKDNKDSMSNVINFMAENYGGGNGGSISGAYVFPKTAISQEAIGIDTYDLDYDKVIEWLEKIGIDVDSQIIREEDNRVYIKIGFDINNAALSATTIGSLDSLIDIQLAHNAIDTTKYSFSISFNNSYNRLISDYIVTEGEVITLRTIFNLCKDSGPFLEGVNLPTIVDLLVADDSSNTHRLYSNEYIVYREAINDIEYGLVKNIDSMIKEVIIPYGSGSGSGDEPEVQPEPEIEVGS